MGAAQGRVVTVRAAPTPVEPLVAGPPARLLDVRHAVATRLPLTVGIVVALSVAVDALVIRPCRTHPQEISRSPASREL
ncbi:hypothetical protein [Streptomyces telluris]|uniref:Uncharacterized protein n=1 Tax=Streptomyces telluris TaxID=2720021 RepID=A0A9X2RLT8_9ACTN|nr:hypothetical protein [Streptomyces telluris]MCQ8771193.1 hypothetical protein [Streptomyces telluris]NJP80600.1 hypothetical protein [Streptomyces telluris]